MLTGQKVWQSTVRNLWNSMQQGRKGRRLRKRRDSSAWAGWTVAAEVMEDRALLSALAYSQGLSSVFTNNLDPYTGASVGPISGDAAGNIYASATFSGTGNIDPLGSGYTVTTDPSHAEWLIAKYSPNLHLQWAITPNINPLGSAGESFGTVLADRSSGALYVSGSISGGSIDLPTATGPLTISSPNGTTVLLMRLDPNTGNVIWLIDSPNTLGAPNGPNPFGTDAAGNLYLIGGGLFNYTPIYGISNSGVPVSITSGGKVYLIKLNSSGAGQWAEQFDGGIGGVHVDVDASGNIYVNASFSQSIDADPSSGVKTFKVPNWTSNILVEKLNSSGRLVWAFQNGVNGQYSYGGTIKVDANGNLDATAAGGRNSAGNTSPGFTFGSGKNAVSGNVAQFDNNGNLKWLKGIHDTSLGNDPAYGGFNIDSGGNIYMFANRQISKLNPSGSVLWSNSVNPNSGWIVDAFGNFWFTESPDGVSTQVNVSPTATPIYLPMTASESYILVEWMQSGGLAAAATKQSGSPLTSISPTLGTATPTTGNTMAQPVIYVGDVTPAAVQNPLTLAGLQDQASLLSVLFA